jgi:ABC-type glycerol-3-phosphate transport system permease component
VRVFILDAVATSMRSTTDYNCCAAAILIAIVPILIADALLQRSNLSASPPVR